MRIRVTTQMLNNNRRRSGLAEGGSSLLNYVNRSSSGGTSRLSAMSAGSIAAARIVGNSYEKLDSASGDLEDQAKLLGAKVNDEDKNIADQAGKLVDSFNETLSSLRSASGVLNQFYYQTMRETASESQDALAEIGISVANDGRLSLNREKLENADAEKVKKLLGSQGDFLKKISTVASRVSDNARAGSESISGRYNSRGDITNSYLSRISYRR